MGAGFLLACALLSAPPAAAQHCPVMDGADPQLADVPAAERAAYLEAQARVGEEQARTWTATFALSYLGLAAGQLAVLTLSEDETRRANMAIGAASSMIGVASLFALPLSILVDIDEVESIAARARAGDCEALARMEQLVAAGAGSEEFGTSWLTHVGSVLFNVGIGLLLGVGYGDWIGGAISAGSGILIGEIQILTQPTPLSHAMARYREAQLTNEPASAASLITSPQPGAGLSVGASF